MQMNGSTQKINWSQKADALTIKPAANYPSENAVTFRITFKR